MKACKRWAKRGALKFVPKVFNTIVILTLVLQPAGTPGIWNIAFAESTEPIAPVVEETAPAPEPVKEEIVTPAEEVIPVVKEEVVPADTITVPVTPTDDPSVSDIPVEPSAPTPSIGDTGASTDIPSDSEEPTPPAEEVVPVIIPSETPVTSTETSVPAPIEEAVSTEAQPTEDEKAPVSKEASVEVAPATPVEEAVTIATEPVVDETECLSASVTGDSETNWTVDEDGNTAVTNGAVELGVRYVYPLDKEVTVTFTCLPKDESKRAPLSIERIVASDINFPEGVAAAGEYAYDITTDGMKNGTFKYDLSLPKFEGANVGIAYIEKSVREVKEGTLDAEDLKKIDQEDINNKEKTVEATNIDHFTVIVPTVITENSSKVRICHATNSHSNPYVSKQPNKSANVSGHNGHSGPIWYPGIADHSWGDIIPPFDYDESSYPGKNWDATGQAIWRNNCAQSGSISGIKFEDKNRDGVHDTGEDGLFSWTIFIDKDGNKTKDTGEQRKVTASGGTYSFTGLTPGTYSVCEVQKPGWQSSLVGGTNCQDATVAIGQDTQVKFGNYRETGSIRVCKIIVDAVGNVVDGSALPGSEFIISGFTPAPVTSEGVPAGVLETTTFTTGLLLNTKILQNSTGNDAQCETHDNLKLGGYYYGKETIPASGWEVPKYNDQFAELRKVETISDFFLYDGRLFDGINNDGLRDKNVDGHIVLTAGRPDRTLVILNQYKTSVISGFKWNDLNGNHEYDCNATDEFTRVAAICEPKLSTWTVFLDTDNDGVLDSGETSTTTNGSGHYRFANLVPGTYRVCEVQQTGWAQTFPQNGINNCHSVTVVPGQTSGGKKFGNVRLGTIIVTKYDDLDGDGTKDADEPELEGWDMHLSQGESFSANETTNVSGIATFDNLLNGSYTLSEREVEGWTLTNISCSNDRQTEDLDLAIDADNDHLVSVSAGETVNCEIGNQRVLGVLEITKTNNEYANGPDQPGDIVTYTITVKAVGGPVTSVSVIDLPPENFEFVPASDTAGSSVGDDHIGLLDLTSEYASPGVWSLGDMEENEVVTLSYQTEIGSVDDGDYPDLAYAKGTGDNGSGAGVILASSAPSDFLVNNGIVNGTYVGTQIAIVSPAKPAAVALTNIVDRNVDTKTVTKTKRVLGAATVLPYTGANINTILFALMMLLSGLILLLLSKRSTWLLIRHLSKSMTKVFLFAVIGSILFAGQSASAASGDLSVRIEQPKAQVSDPNFKIGFVVLDISNSAPDVTCEVNDGGGFVNFPAAHIEYVAQPGGNSGNCVVDASVMPSDGTYTFRVTAADESVQSDEVSVKLISGTPSTPLNYVRADGSCTASFTTANDELTSKVELYRSTFSTFTADASTLVQEVAIGPNISGSITDPNGNCGDYFYAIRAVAASGLGSGFVGDERVVIDNENKIKYKTETKKVAGKTTTLGAIPVTGGGAGTGTEGAVEGASTVNGEEEAAQPGTGADGSVLGAASEEGMPAGFWDWMKNHPWKSLFGLVVLVVFIRYAHQAYLKKT